MKAIARLLPCPVASVLLSRYFGTAVSFRPGIGRRCPTLQNYHHYQLVGTTSIQASGTTVESRHILLASAKSCRRESCKQSGRGAYSPPTYLFLSQPYLFHFFIIWAPVLSPSINRSRSVTSLTDVQTNDYGTGVVHNGTTVRVFVHFFDCVVSQARHVHMAALYRHFIVLPVQTNDKTIHVCVLFDVSRFEPYWTMSINDWVLRLSGGFRTDDLIRGSIQ